MFLSDLRQHIILFKPFAKLFYWTIFHTLLGVSFKKTVRILTILHDNALLIQYVGLSESVTIFENNFIFGRPPTTHDVFLVTMATNSHQTRVKMCVRNMPRATVNGR